MGRDLGCAIQVHIQATSPPHLPAHVPQAVCSPILSQPCYVLNEKAPPRLMCLDTWSAAVVLFMEAVETSGLWSTEHK